MADLKPCPFCGGEVKGYLDNHKKAMIECENCNMYFGVKLEIGCELVEGWKATFDSKEELFEAWNTRKPMEAVVAELEVEKERHEKDRTYWSEHSWKDSLMYNECDMSDRKADCFETAISIVRGKE